MSMLYNVVLFIIVLALCYVLFSYKKIKGMKEGTQEMAEMALIIRLAANPFMKTEYKPIAIVVNGDISPL